MKLSDKIAALRKSRGMSQEELAEKLQVSRQAVSRWEVGSAMPDASNLLQLSRLFGVTADYLLNEDYESDQDLPRVKELRQDQARQILLYFTLLEIMILIMQFMSVHILQSEFWALITFLPFLALIGGFEYACRKNAGARTPATDAFRRRFYKLSAWLGLYFPIRFVMNLLVTFYPRPYSSLVFDCVVLVVYISAATLVMLSIDARGRAKDGGGK